MKQVLLVVLALFGLLVIVLFIAARIVLAKVRKALLGLGAALTSGAPAEVTLVPEKSPKPKNAEAFTQAVKQLQGLGFGDRQTFVVMQIPELVMAGLFDTRNNVTACVYDHPAAGVFVDLVTKYEDETSCTFTNGPDNSHLQSHPLTRKHYCTGMGLDELLRRHLAERPAGTVRPVAASAFKAYFEKTYRDEMDWRNSRGGATPAEIRAQAERGGQTVTEEQVQAAWRSMSEDAWAKCQASLCRRLEDSGQGAYNPAQVVFIYDTIPPETLLELFEEWADTRFDATPAGYPPRPAFTVLNERLPVEKRFRKVGELGDPVPSDAWLYPRGDDHGA